MRLERFTVEVPPTPGGVAALLFSLMRECGAKTGFAISNADNRPLRKDCAYCGRAEWAENMSSFHCERNPQGRTAGVAVPCSGWLPAPGVVVLDEDTGAVFLARVQNE